ncbi:MAG: hypothetical protein ABIF82_09530 [Planctomycetota bacterium]
MSDGIRDLIEEQYENRARRQGLLPDEAYCAIAEANNRIRTLERERDEARAEVARVRDQRDEAWSDLSDAEAEVERLRVESAEAFATYIQQHKGMIEHLLLVDGELSGTSLQSAFQTLDDFRAALAEKDPLKEAVETMKLPGPVEPVNLGPLETFPPKGEKD